MLSVPTGRNTRVSRPPENVPDEQPELLAGMARATVRAQKGPAKKAVVITEVNPVARVLVDLQLAHLDRPFDYAVPQTMADTAVPGARVKVRFDGQDVGAFLLAGGPGSEQAGRTAEGRGGNEGGRTGRWRGG